MVNDVLMIAGTCLYFLMGIHYIIVFWHSRNEPCIKPRNPLLVCITGLMSIFLAIVLFYSVFVHFPCHIIVILYWGEVSLQTFPNILRGIQYIVVTEEDYREKYSKHLKTNASVVKKACFFAFFHHLILEICFFSLESYHQCLMSWDAFYLAFICICLVGLTLFVYRKVPWNFDSFAIGAEIKMLILCYTFTGIVSFALAIAQALTGFGDDDFEGFQLWKVINIIFVIKNTSSFVICNVWPLHNNTAIARYSSETGRKRNNKVLPEERIINKENLPSQQSGVGKCNSIYAYYSSSLLRKLKPQISNSNCIPTPQNTDGGLEKQEIANWAQRQCHQEALEDKVCRQTFRGKRNLTEIFEETSVTCDLYAFAFAHLVPESVLFLHAVFQYKHANSSPSTSERHAMFLDIITSYIKKDACFEVSVGFEMRQKILTYCNVRAFSALSDSAQTEIFDEAYNEVGFFFWRDYIGGFPHDVKPQNLKKVRFGKHQVRIISSAESG
mmetsp:Transcript_33688/g.43041  ORF Transcript_33688/g.43041 Transcript_33688/m.43041 type:complete len:498 (+) Transcript_33688:137-1630(+)